MLKQLMSLQTKKDEEPGGSSENNEEVSNHLVDNSPSVEKDIAIVVIDD